MSLLQDACVSRSVDCHFVSSVDFDFCQLPVLVAGDMLFNIGRGSREIECFLLKKDVATLYRDIRFADFATSTTLWSLIHQRHGLPVPRTISHGTTDRLLLNKYTTYLGGPPVIIKVSGGTRGIGVIVAETMHSLYSIVDFLVSRGESFLMREYLPTKEVARLIVVGERVISSLAYILPPDDFRSSIKADPVAEARNYSDTIEKLAVEAVHVLGVEFGGVDIIVAGDGQPYILEVNSPASFQRPQRVTGVNIAGAIVEHLLKKRASILSKTVDVGPLDTRPS